MLAPPLHYSNVPIKTQMFHFLNSFSLWTNLAVCWINLVAKVACYGPRALKGPDLPGSLYLFLLKTFFFFFFFLLVDFSPRGGCRIYQTGGGRSKHWPPGAGDPRYATGLGYSAPEAQCQLAPSRRCVESRAIFRKSIELAVTQELKTNDMRFAVITHEWALIGIN